MRARIVRLLDQLKNTHKVSLKNGLYPPDVKPSINQTDDELYDQFEETQEYVVEDVVEYMIQVLELEK